MKSGNTIRRSKQKFCWRLVRSYNPIVCQATDTKRSLRLRVQTAFSPPTTITHITTDHSYQPVLQMSSSLSNNIASLVRYDNPVLTTDVGRTKRTKQAGASTGTGGGLNGSTLNKTKGSKPQLLPPVENKSQITQTEDILNSILPPR